MISACNCRVLSDGCKFCQPEEYIKVLEDAIEEQQEYIKELEDEIQGLENSKEFLLKVNEDLEDENERLFAANKNLQDGFDQIYEDYEKLLKDKEPYRIKNAFFDENGFPTHVLTETGEIFYTTDSTTWEMRSEKTKG